MLTAYLFRNDKTFEPNVTRQQMHHALMDKDSLLWVDLENPTDFENETLVEIFNFHPLAIEDCVADLSPPKVDDYEEHLFIIAHAVNINENKELSIVELNIFLGKNFVVTYHKEPLKSISRIREAVLKKPEGWMGHGSDILVHAVLDQVVDKYQPILDFYEEEIDRLEEEIFNHPPKNYLKNIMQLKKDIFRLRRILAPQRDILNYLTRTETPFIQPGHMIYFRDIYDHIYRLYGAIDGFHDAFNGVLQAYFSYTSNKANETMQRMTVLATLSMPCIMIAGIYGMNFQTIPELTWQYGYPYALGLMAATSLGMLIWMKLKKWI